MKFSVQTETEATTIISLYNISPTLHFHVIKPKSFLKLILRFCRRAEQSLFQLLSSKFSSAHNGHARRHVNGATEKVIFNAPFIDKYKLPLRITNDGSRQVGWAIKTNCPARISADPPCGVLGPKEKAILYVTCEPFDYNSTDVSADRITIEWVLTPEGAPKQFKREWFQGDVITRRKNISINYNK